MYKNHIIMSSSFGIIFLIIAIFQVLTTTINAQQQDVTSDVRNDENTEFAFAVGNDDEALTDQICGTHPLKTIVKKIENSRKCFFIKHNNYISAPRFFSFFTGSCNF